MNIVLPIFFCAAAIGLFSPKRRMTPALWALMVTVIIGVIVNQFLKADSLIAAAGGSSSSGGGSAGGTN